MWEEPAKKKGEPKDDYGIGLIENSASSERIFAVDLGG